MVSLCHCIDLKSINNINGGWGVAVVVRLQNKEIQANYILTVKSGERHSFKLTP